MSSKGEKHVHICPACGHGFVSQDVDDGETPLFTVCINDRCSDPKAVARIFVYFDTKALLDHVKPAVEWYRPGKREIARLSPKGRAHVEQGGLLSRRADP